VEVVFQQSAMPYPPNWSFEGVNSLLLLAFCCLVCSAFGIKQNQIGHLQDDHFIRDSGYEQRGIQMLLGGHFKEVKPCVQLMESKESAALVAATRKKYTPAAGPHYYCMWEAIDGISNKKQSEPMDYRKGSLHHSQTNTRNDEATGSSVQPIRTQLQTIDVELESLAWVSLNDLDKRFKERERNGSIRLCTTGIEAVSSASLIFACLVQDINRKWNKDFISNLSRWMHQRSTNYKQLTWQKYMFKSLDCSRKVSRESTAVIGFDRFKYQDINKKDKSGRITKGRGIDGNPIALAVISSQLFNRQGRSCVSQEESIKTYTNQLGRLFDPGIMGDRNHTKNSKEQGQRSLAFFILEKQVTMAVSKTRQRPVAMKSKEEASDLCHCLPLLNIGQPESRQAYRSTLQVY
jgi:hypothetical protein